MKNAKHPRKLLTYLIATIVFNTAIAGVLTLLMPEHSFRENLVFANSIGLTVMLVCTTIVKRVRNTLKKATALVLALPVTVAIGISLGYALTGKSGWDYLQILQSMVIGLFFGVIGAVAFLLNERAEAEARQRQLVESESEKRALEAHLKLLQAQIEPHFLFNTLANVGSLIDSDPTLARKLLERLNDWLRVALARTRSDQASLGDELDMLCNYLEIMKIRFGERLRWRIDIADEARRLPFPPMLLQPLVENAVRHGIEPKVGGGEIDICTTIDPAPDAHSAGSLRIDVCDSGVGLAADNRPSATAGTGLANVRARLAALFGDAGHVTLSGNASSGATATLLLPLSELAR